MFCCYCNSANGAENWKEAGPSSRQNGIKKHRCFQEEKGIPLFVVFVVVHFTASQVFGIFNHLLRPSRGSEISRCGGGGVKGFVAGFKPLQAKLPSTIDCWGGCQSQ